MDYALPRVFTAEKSVARLIKSATDGDLDAVRQRLQRAREDRSLDTFVTFLNGTDTLAMTALHHAAWNGHRDIVLELFSYSDFITVNCKMKSGFTGLHLACLKHHVEVVKLFLAHPVDAKFSTPLDYAVIGGDATTVAVLISNPTSRANLAERQKGLTPLEMASMLIHKAGVSEDKAVHKFNLMISMLSERPEVKSSLEVFVKDKQVFVDAANAILVGAALIASITFAGWLQPPLGFQPYFDTKYLMIGLAPPDTFESYAAVRQHLSIQIFWVFNSLSFFFAIATVLSGASAVLPSQETIGKVEVEHIRRLLIRTVMVLSLSVFFVLGAFIAAGFGSLPPSLEYQWGLILTSGVGGSIYIIVLYQYYRRLFRLLRFSGIARLTFRQKAQYVLDELVGASNPPFAPGSATANW
ncbi:unnamed protein product [Calypogeia fissa]